MVEWFNADEIFEIAQQIELNGAAFYRRAAELSAAPDARALLASLADMETHHERVFAVMRDDLWREDPEWLAKMLDANGASETALYLQAIADGRVFDFKGDPAASLTESTSLASILQVAIGLEKDSIVFYLGIKAAMPEGVGKEKLEDILREEMTHISLLSRQLAAQQG